MAATSSLPQILTTIVVLSVTVLSVSGQQAMPVFLGQNTPPVGPFSRARAFASGPQWRNNPSNIPVIGNRDLTGQFGRTVRNSLAWAPGQGRGGPTARNRGQWISPCQRRGCRSPGSHCVFWRRLCPSTMRGVPCECEQGCRVDTYFIALGQSQVMDRCGNVCRCMSTEGFATCTTRRC